MKAAFIDRPGPPESIRFGELPRPEPRAGEVLVRVRAVAVNPIDTYVRGGLIPMEIPRPFIVGCDLAGVVEAVGSGATRFRAGDRVWGSNQGILGRQGTFAEYAAVADDFLYPIPDGVRDRDAAATALVGITAHLGLVRAARLRRGETLFVNGGTGGVGSVVVQMARALGARVATTGGTDERVARCRELGADLAINYRTEDVEAAVKEFAPGGVNVFWETRREPDFDRAVRMLAERGRIVVMAGRDARPQFPVGPFYVKECSLHGFVMFKASAEEQREAAADLNRWLAAGTVRANIGRVLPLAETAVAHRLQEESTIGLAGTLAGKIVLEP
jgi:NADPH2:quinone reductase